MTVQPSNPGSDFRSQADSPFQTVVQIASPDNSRPSTADTLAAWLQNVDDEPPGGSRSDVSPPVFSAGSSQDDRRQSRSGSERRTSERRRSRLRVPNLHARLLCHSEPGQRCLLEGKFIDVSPTGIRLHTSRKFALGEAVLVEVRLPSGNCLNLSATVAWVRPEPEGFHVGCRLMISPSGAQMAELRRLAMESGIQ